MLTVFTTWLSYLSYAIYIIRARTNLTVHGKARQGSVGSHQWFRFKFHCLICTRRALDSKNSAGRLVKKDIHLRGKVVWGFQSPPKWTVRLSGWTAVSNNSENDL